MLGAVFDVPQAVSLARAESSQDQGCGRQERTKFELIYSLRIILTLEDTTATRNQPHVRLFRRASLLSRSIGTSTPDQALGMSVLTRPRPGPLAVLQSKRGFVDKFPLSATIEVAEAFGDPIDETKTELTRAPKLDSVRYGDELYWQVLMA